MLDIIRIRASSLHPPVSMVMLGSHDYNVDARVADDRRATSVRRQLVSDQIFWQNMDIREGQVE